MSKNIQEIDQRKFFSIFNPNDLDLDWIRTKRNSNFFLYTNYLSLKFDVSMSKDTLGIDRKMKLEVSDHWNIKLMFNGH